MTLSDTLRARVGLLALTIGLMSLVLPPRAHAGAVASCIEPFAFKEAEVNVVVLPYFQAGPSKRPLNRLGSQLALLVKLETLYRALGYDHWGVVLLTGEKEACDPERIGRKLAAERIQPGGRLILVWGKLYQQDEDVYVQTFARFYRKPIPNEKVSPPEVRMQLGNNRFLGRIVGHNFSFPPEQLPIKIMDAIASNFEKAAFIYNTPDPNSTKYPLPLGRFLKCDHCENALAYIVDGRKGDWIHIRTHEGQSGYLLAHLDEGMSLDRQLPEVDFVQGLMGFVRYAAPLSGENVANNLSGMEVAREALQSYTKHDDAAQEPETAASALQLSGILAFAENQKDSSEQFDAAFQLVPYSADARNLAAMFRLYRDYNSPVQTIRALDTANDFIAAVALEPRNVLVLGNLQSYYELLMTPAAQAKVAPGTAIEPREIEAQLQKVRSILKKLATSSTPVAEVKSNNTTGKLDIAQN